MTKYDKEYIEEKMADFNEFRAALRAAGYEFYTKSEILLYTVWKR